MCKKCIAFITLVTLLLVVSASALGADEKQDCTNDTLNEVTWSSYWISNSRTELLSEEVFVLPYYDVLPSYGAIGISSCHFPACRPSFTSISHIYRKYIPLSTSIPSGVEWEGINRCNVCGTEFLFSGFLPATSFVVVGNYRRVTFQGTVFFQRSLSIEI